MRKANSASGVSLRLSWSRSTIVVACSIMFTSFVVIAMEILSANCKSCMMISVV